MSRTIVNFWLDLTLLVLFLTLAWVSVVLHFVFPPGTAAEGWLLWGFGYLQWRGFQFGTLAALGAAVLLHVMLHWSWVCGVFFAQIRRTKSRPDDGMQTIYGVGFLILVLNLLGAGFAAAMLTIQSPPGY